MTTALASLLLAVTAATTPAARPSPAPAALPARPKLVLAVAIDQFRYDYLTRVCWVAHASQRPFRLT